MVLPVGFVLILAEFSERLLERLFPAYFAEHLSYQLLWQFHSTSIYNSPFQWCAAILSAVLAILLFDVETFAAAIRWYHSLAMPVQYTA